jgi:hypothetical protein
MKTKYRHYLYKRWKNMLDNTTNPNCHNYQHQGALGVRVDREFWDFWRFVDHVETNLGRPVKPRNYLIRLDKNKHWEPGNLSWATAQESGWHRRDNMMIKYRGKKKPLGEWCSDLKLPYMRTFNRIWDYGWTVKDAFEIRENVV